MSGCVVVRFAIKLVTAASVAAVSTDESSCLYHTTQSIVRFLDLLLVSVYTQLVFFGGACT